MTNEEILEIVKLKYEDAKISDNKIILGEIFYTKKLDTKTGFISSMQSYSALLNAKTNILFSIYIEDNKIKFSGYNENGSGYNCDLEFEFKNSIELKHLLNIEITKQDIIDWLNTFSEEFNSFYDIPTKTFCELFVYIKEKCLCLSVCIDGAEGNIFTATNSQEYWRFYNIIKNLKE